MMREKAEIEHSYYSFKTNPNGNDYKYLAEFHFPGNYIPAFFRHYFRNAARFDVNVMKESDSLFNISEDRVVVIVSTNQNAKDLEKLPFGDNLVHVAVVYRSLSTHTLLEPINDQEHVFVQYHRPLQHQRPRRRMKRKKTAPAPYSPTTRDR